MYFGLTQVGRLEIGRIFNRRLNETFFFFCSFWFFCNLEKKKKIFFFYLLKIDVQIV